MVVSCPQRLFELVQKKFVFAHKIFFHSCTKSSGSSMYISTSNILFKDDVFTSI